VIAWGAGTGVSGSQFPLSGNELILDFHLMNHILELDEETMTLTVEPGVLLGDLQEYTESRGYFYPPDPASKHSSIGGNVATNAGGNRAVKYGTTREYVRELTVVLVSGEVLTLGSLNVKSSSGYDLKDLFIGSEGTLGITTQIKLKLLPLPAFRKSLLVAFDTVDDATKGANLALKSGADPAAIELFERTTIDYAEKYLGYPLASQKGKAYLLFLLDGNDAQIVESQEALLIDQVKEVAVEIVELDKEEEKKTWKLRDAILFGVHAYSEYEMLDEVVPVNKFGELIEYTNTLPEKHGVEVLSFGHAGDGNVHTLLMHSGMAPEVWQEKRAALLEDLYQKVSDLGGLPSAEHGIGTQKQEHFLKMTDPVKVAYMRKIKQVFDPDNKLNPGKIF